MGPKLRRPVVYANPRRVIPSRFLAVVGLAVLAALGIIVLKQIDAAKKPGFAGDNALAVTTGVAAPAISVEVEPLQPVPRGEGYFVNYRLEREQQRQEAKAMLSGLLNSPVARIREEAQSQWLDLTTKIAQEDEIENLLKIKGYKDAVTAVNADGIAIFVYASGLTPNEVALIRDVVIRVTKIRADKITVMAKN